MPKLIKKYTNKFTTITNEIFMNNALSYKDIGLLIQMLSLPDDWEFNAKGLATLHKDCVNSVQNGLVSLEKVGYLTRVRRRDEKGRLNEADYWIYDDPRENQYYNKYHRSPIIINYKGEVEENHKSSICEPKINYPSLENPEVDNPILDEPVLEKGNNKENKNKESIYKSTSTIQQEVNSLFDEKIDLKGMEITVKQARDINELVYMIGTHQINSSKDDLMNFLHKIYDEKKKDFFMENGSKINNLKLFIISAFNNRTEYLKEENATIKNLADKGNPWASDYVEKHPNEFNEEGENNDDSNY